MRSGLMQSLMGGSIDDQFSNLINWFSFPFVIIFPSCGKPHSHV